jgi:hypothetical protein
LCPPLVGMKNQYVQRLFIFNRRTREHYKDDA